MYYHVAGFLGVDCSVNAALTPVITGIRTGPVCDARGPNPCTFISLFLTQFTFIDTFTCRFVRMTTQPPCLHNLVSFRRTHSSSIVTLARSPTSSSLKITDRSFRSASPCLFVKLILVPVPPFPTYLFLYPSFDSPLSSSVTPSLFYTRLKFLLFLFLKSYPPTPLISLLPPGQPSRTIA